ncbi:MAG: mevalonate kinase [Gammaproteobacteria bacterium]
MSFKASSPGSLMLLGEHAVLHNKLALVCAVDKRISVTITPRNDKNIQITSALGQYTTQLSQIKMEPPFQFVLATLKKFQKQMPSGCDINITSEFSDKIGFASSAAVTVATLSALLAWLSLSKSKEELVQLARSIIRKVQGMGSGADVAACVFGGIIAYRARPLTIEKLPFSHPITVVYSGSKTPTNVVVKQVLQSFANKPKTYQQLCQSIDHCAIQGRLAILEQNWPELGKIMNIQQGLMDALGVNTSILNNIVYTLRDQPKILGSKISGSGLGDCIIGLGSISDKAMESIAVKITDQGACCE